MIIVTISGSDVIVDRDLWESHLRFINWWIPKHHPYVIGFIRKHNPVVYPQYANRTVKMHRLIAGLDSPLLCDHINRNTLDNRQCNLRLVDFKWNSTNRGKNIHRSSSAYKGVKFTPNQNRKWYMRLKDNGRVIHMKAFDCERDAALAYDICARRLWGEYASLNIPDASGEDLERVQRLLSSHKRFRGSSQYVGVTKIHDSRWVAKIKINGRHKYITSKQTELEAATAYNEYAKLYGGPKNRLNPV